MSHVLDYAPRLPWYKRRHTRRLMTWAFVLLSIASFAYYFGPSAYRRTMLLYWQNRCMNHLDPPGTIALDVPPIPPATFRPPATGLPWPLSECERYWDFTQRPNEVLGPFFGLKVMIAFSGMDAHSVFLHKRTCPAGDRMVIAFANSDSSGLRSLPYVSYGGIQTFAIVPGTFLKDPTLASRSEMWTNLPIPLHETNSLRVYTGQPDPTDPAAFTIDFDLNATRHTARFALTPTGDQANLISVTPPL